MKLALKSLAVVAALSFGWFASAATNSPACECVNCQCPDCNGLVCSCEDGCECGLCACAQ